MLAGRLRIRTAHHKPSRIGAAAVGVRTGWRTAQAYLDQPGVRVVSAGARHRAIASEMAAVPGLRSDDVPDVGIAALAIEHGLILASHDHGFRRFDALRLLDPLDEAPE